MKTLITAICMMFIAACGGPETQEKPVEYDWSKAEMIDFEEDGVMSFNDAHEFCESKTTSLEIYRLPTIDELRAHLWPDHELFGPDGLCDTEEWDINCYPVELRVPGSERVCFWSDTEKSKNENTYYVACPSGTGVVWHTKKASKCVMCLRLKK